MTVSYPGYTHLFASTDPQEPRSVPLRKAYLQAVLHDLHQSAHHIYVLLDHLPQYRFRIVRYYDYARFRIGLKTSLKDEIFSLTQFLHYADMLHELDEFRVYFYTEACCSEQSFTPYTLAIIYRHYLKYLCEQGLRTNRPLRLTRSLIRSYALTRADAQIVGPLIGQFSSDIVQRLRMEYHLLSTLDCLKKGTL